MNQQRLENIFEACSGFDGDQALNISGYSLSKALLGELYQQISVHQQTMLDYSGRITEHPIAASASALRSVQPDGRVALAFMENAYGTRDFLSLSHGIQRMTKQGCSGPEIISSQYRSSPSSILKIFEFGQQQQWHNILREIEQELSKKYVEQRILLTSKYDLVRIADHEGKLGYDLRTEHVANAEVKVQGFSKTMTMPLFAFSGRDIPTNLDQVWRQSIYAMDHKITALREGEKPRAGMCDVVLGGLAAGTFLHEFGHEAEADQRRHFHLEELVGEGLAPEYVTLVDRPSSSGGYGEVHYEIDDEGVSPKEVVLLEDGTLTANALESRYTAHLRGTQPTGNARRSSAGANPQPRMRNLELVDSRPETDIPTTGELISDISSGLFIPAFDRAANNGGEFTVEASHAFNISGGRITGYVGPLSVVIDDLTFLSNIQQVGMKSKSALSPCYKRDDIVNTNTSTPSLQTKLSIRPM